MKAARDLLPKLQEWNAGKGVSPEDWLCAKARSDEAVAYAAFFWPEIVEHEDYILLAGFSERKLREFEAAGWTRSQTEVAMNYNSLETFFLEEGDQTLADERARFVCRIMVDMLDAKLRRDFPGRRCAVHFLDSDEDFAVTFCQE